MENYFVYGLNLRSEIPLPELPPGKGEADIILRSVRLEFPCDADKGRTHSFQRKLNGVLMTWFGVARFFITGGKEILVEPAEEADKSLIHHLILGPILGTLLIQRGINVYHASAVVLPQGGVGFIAQKGHGKSTLASFFTHQGRLLICDDVLALQYNNCHVWTFPAAPIIKLWPDAMIPIGEDPDGYPRINMGIEKRVLRIEDRYSQTPISMCALFVLSPGPRIKILPLQPKDALSRVMPHWYGALFGGELLPILGLERHLKECISLVEKLPIYLLSAPSSLELLPEICKEIECQVETIVSKIS